MKLKLYDKHQSTYGLDANIIAALVYVIPGILGLLIPQISSFTFLIPILAYFFERKSMLVRFHCLQYIFMSLFSSTALYILVLMMLYNESLSVFAVTIYNSFTVGMFGALLVCMFKAFQWRSWRFPILGAFTSKIIHEELDS